MKVEQLSLFDMPAQQIKKASCLSVGDLSKVLASKGFNIGQTRLFKKLRELNLIDKYNVPYQRYIEGGWFKIIKEPFYKRGMESVNVYLKVLVTPNGQKYIEDILRSEANDNRA